MYSKNFSQEWTKHSTIKW